MRCEVMIDGESAGKSDFAIAPKAGDLVLSKLGAAKVDSVCHDLVQDRPVLNCTSVKESGSTSPSKQQDSVSVSKSRFSRSEKKE